MTNRTTKIEIKVVAIDLAKSSFQLHGANKKGQSILRKKLTRSALKQCMVNLPACEVFMEACGGAHYWARTFQSYGHTVKLIAPQFVKPFVKSNKNDAADAEAIYEASQRPTMRFVSIKEVAHQDMQSAHRVRSLAVGQRTALVNQIRGLLGEYGVVVGQGRKTLSKALPHILENADNGLSAQFRAMLSGLKEELSHLDERIKGYDQQIQAVAHQDEQAKRLLTIPGVGPIVATALLAAIGNGKAFNTTGGKERLLGISKRGDVYVRSLLIHGARAHMNQVHKKDDARSRWANELRQRRPNNVATVAMANKIARTAFALLNRGEDYRCAA